MKLQKITFEKIIISLIAVWSAFGSYIFDWNHTHNFNPLCPPHAKFYDAQTLLFGTCLGFLSLYIIWVAQINGALKVRISLLLANLYWMTQVGAILFPGTAFSDPAFSYPGEVPHRLIIDFGMLTLLVISWPAEIHIVKKLS